MEGTIRYRKRFDVDAPPLWHFNPACPEYPTGAYVERADMPPVKDLCPNCAAPEAKQPRKS
jgi:hypothetical protein